MAVMALLACLTRLITLFMTFICVYLCLSVSQEPLRREGIPSESMGFL